jgi:hypothetical protein
MPPLFLHGTDHDDVRLSNRATKAASHYPLRLHCPHDQLDERTFTDLVVGSVSIDTSLRAAPTQI